MRDKVLTTDSTYSWRYTLTLTCETVWCRYCSHDFLGEIVNKTSNFLLRQIQKVQDKTETQIFMSLQQNQRQIRWAQFLADFNFTLKHRAGAQNRKPDILSRNLKTLYHRGRSALNTWHCLLKFLHR
ncbi:hypothetical protein PROFUN_15434 [Planoprotostelium fungivorum]|uniref:Reverse transcriptase RNase H-like domain-containing protein n=1 Tax=Planoprotostelium fungivorum TaxID=1890364 RepID=A0A2P6MWM8_9EUKA|nr:hypothetical protein PROFUN_15434 [Planoprotostelium fungivorum]